VAQLGVGDPASAARLWRSCVAALAAGAVLFIVGGVVAATGAS